MKGPSDTEFVIVRHGQTVANRTHILQGRMESPLDECGLRQAAALAERLRDEPFDRIFSSSLRRAEQTAEAIRAYHPGVPFESLDDLREWALGDLEGRPLAQLEKEYPEIMAAFRQETGDLLIPGGETQSAFARRVSDCLDRLADRHPGGRLLLVTHGGVLRSVFRKVIGKVTSGNLLPFSDNASINVFRRRPSGWQMISWNDSAHLRGIGTSDLLTY